MMPTLSAFYQRLGFWFSMQLLCCCAVFAYRFPRRSHFFVRLPIAVFVYLSASFWLCSVYFLWDMTVTPQFVILQLVYFVLIWVVLLACLVFCFSIGWKETVFIGIGSYAAQHIVYSVSMFVRYFFPDLTDMYWFTSLCEGVPLIAVCLLVWLLLTRKGKLQMRRRELRFLPLAAIMVASCIVLSSLSTMVQTEEALFISRVVGRLYAVICCVLILILQFGFTRENELESDKETMELLLHAEQEKHRVNRETVDLINIKCHDLKHQLAVLRDMEQKPARDEAIAEIEQAVQFYDSNIRTGNGTLDLILTQKSFFCYSKHISLECVADGKCLDFMKPSDLSSLFGNILDNAIEAVQAFPPAQRRIALRIERRSDVVFVHADNPCGAVRFRDGLPQTTKADKAYHGFGVRSIRYIVQKYGGDIHMYCEEGRFNVDILFSDAARPNAV